MERQRQMTELNFTTLIHDFEVKSKGQSLPIFSINIYQKDIYLDNDKRHSIATFFDQFIADHNQSQSNSNFTGDVKGFGSIHRLAILSDLIKELEDSVLNYIATFSRMVDKIQVYHQKSWPVVITKGGSVDCHKHGNADLSAVYYLDVPEGEGGELVFYSPLTMGLPSNSSGVDFFRPKECAHAIKPYTGLLVIFPSALKHEVRTYQGDNPRLSLSFDFTITASESQGSGMLENFPPAISYWSVFGKTD